AKYAGRGEPTATGLIKGKFAYMAPEQGAGLRLDRRTDVFALGVVLWEALVGQRLFAADTPAQTLLRINTVRPVDPHVHRAEVGPALSAVTLRCLARDPAERFATAAELAEALRSALRERATHVDEADLGALVGRFFGPERRRSMADLEERAEATTAHEPTDTTVVEDTRPPQPARRGPRLVGVVVVAAAVVVTAAVAFVAMTAGGPASRGQPSSPAAPMPPSSWSTR
ncbi:MAG: hypothetical protein EOO75_19855, partial [Myxococcales bacterium]